MAVLFYQFGGDFPKNGKLLLRNLFERLRIFDTVSVNQSLNGIMLSLRKTVCGDCAVVLYTRKIIH